MKLNIVVFIAGFVLAACRSASSPSAFAPDDKLSEIQARGTLVIATDADYLPQSKLIPNTLPSPSTKCESSQYTASQLTGFDVKVAIELARRLGVEPCFVTPPWSQAVAGKWDDNWDVHVGSMAITHERMNVLYFSQPYYATPVVILIHKDNPTFKHPEDLSGKRIGVCAGCTFETYLQGTLQMPGETIDYRIYNAQIVAYENEAPAIDMLSLGDGVALDATITLLPNALASLTKGKPLQLMGEPIWFEYSAVAVDRSSRRNTERLLAAIDSAIQELHRTGTLRELSLRYYAMDLTQEAAQFDIQALGQTP